MWYSRGEPRPARARSRASRASRSRSSSAWRVTVSSTSQPREGTMRSLPSSPTAYIALRWPASVALPSWGTSRSRMRGHREIHEAAREAAALGHEAQDALAFFQPAAPEQLVEHEVDRRRAGVADALEVGEPALRRHGQPGAGEPVEHRRAEV